MLTALRPPLFKILAKVILGIIYHFGSCQLNIVSKFYIKNRTSLSIHVFKLFYLVMCHYFLCGRFVCTFESTLIDFYDVEVISKTIKPL